MRALLVAMLGVLALVSLTAAVAVPVAAEALVERVLATVPDYKASVEDADVALVGAAALDGVVLRKPGLAHPFLSVERVEIRPRLGALLRGDRIVDLRVEGLVVNYVVGPDEASSQTGLDADWIRRVIASFPFPFTVDRLTVRAAFHYHDHAARPDVHVAVDPLLVDGANLANLERSEEPLFGRLAVQGRIEQHGRLTARVAVDPYADAPRFALDARVEDVALADLNDALRAYAGLDVARGTWSATTHLDAEGGRYEGAVRPRIDDLDVVGDREEQGPLAALWEAAVGTAADAAEAVGVSAELPVSGRFDEAPALVVVLERLPAAWFGALAHAARVGAEATGEAARGAIEAGRAAERERGDR